MNTSWAHARTNIISILPDYVRCLKAGYNCRIVRTDNSKVLFPVKDPKSIKVYAIEILDKRKEVPILIKLHNQAVKFLFFWKPKYKYKLDMGSYICHMLSWGAVSIDIRIPKRQGEKENASLSASRM